MIMPNTQHDHLLPRSKVKVYYESLEFVEIIQGSWPQIRLHFSKDYGTGYVKTLTIFSKHISRDDLKKIMRIFKEKNVRVKIGMMPS